LALDRLVVPLSCRPDRAAANRRGFPRRSRRTVSHAHTRGGVEIHAFADHLRPAPTETRNLITCIEGTDCYTPPSAHSDATAYRRGTRWSGCAQAPDQVA